jgi:hypothetical protein
MDSLEPPDLDTSEDELDKAENAEMGASAFDAIIVGLKVVPLWAKVLGAVIIGLLLLSILKSLFSFGSC